MLLRLIRVHWLTSNLLISSCDPGQCKLKEKRPSFSLNRIVPNILISVCQWVFYLLLPLVFILLTVRPSFSSSSSTFKLVLKRFHVSSISRRRGFAVGSLPGFSVRLECFLCVCVCVPQSKVPKYWNRNYNSKYELLKWECDSVGNCTPQGKACAQFRNDCNLLTSTSFILPILLGPPCSTTGFCLSVSFLWQKTTRNAFFILYKRIREKSDGLSLCLRSSMGQTTATNKTDDPKIVFCFEILIFQSVQMRLKDIHPKL